MKINRPEGISQANRSNPYFIVLRKVTDIQIQLAEDCAQTFVENLAITTIVGIVGIILPAIILTIFTSTLLSMMTSIVNVASAYIIFKILQDIKESMYDALLRCSYKEVDQMIFTNEYQSAAINQEMIFNMFQEACEVNGDLRTILKCLNMQRRWSFILSGLLILASILITCLYAMI